MNKLLQNLFLIILVSLTLSGCGSDLNKKYEGFKMPESVAEGPDGKAVCEPQNSGYHAPGCF